MAPAAVAALRALLDSKVADINNVGRTAGRRDHGGAVPPRFVQPPKAWAHFDIFAWTPSAKPARPEGGECQVARALYALLKERYAQLDPGSGLRFR